MHWATLQHFSKKEEEVGAIARYMCTDTCGGSVNEEEFIRGKNECAIKGCPMHGKP